MAKSFSPGKLLFLLLLLVAAGAGWYVWQRNADHPPEFTAVPITRGDITQVVTATGDLEPVLNVTISSQISGIVSKLYVDWNTPVKKNQLLLEIDPSTYQTALSQAKAQLTNEQANANLVKVTTDRSHKLFSHDPPLVSQSDLDTADAQLAQALAQVDIAKANVDTAQVNLDRCEIYSPIDGVIILRSVDIGNTVAASLSAPTLFQIANDLKKMQINADVSEADIGNISEGQDVTFTVDAYPNREFHGKVSQIRNSPITQQNVVVYAVMIDVNNDDLKLKPGMTATSAIIVASRPQTIKVPNSALRVHLPDALLPETATTVPVGPSGPAAPAATAATGASGGRGGNPAVRDLLREVGIDPRGGVPPSPDALARLQQLAKDRGIDLPDRYSADRGAPIVTRTLYTVAGPSAQPVFQAVRVKLGITDGVNTEVLDGLKEGDNVVISFIPADAKSAAAPVNNPFGGGGGGPGGNNRRGF
jgi:HlyD family secretion protein